MPDWWIPKSADQAGAVGGPTLAGLRIAHQRGMTAPPVEAPGRDSVTEEPGHERAEAADAVKDEPAPAPSANVPARSATPETDPKAADSQ